MSILGPTVSSLPEYQQMIVINQIIQNYLEAAIQELSRYSGEITLGTILRNDTRLIELVKASFDATPEILELLMTQPMATQQVILKTY